MEIELSPLLLLGRHISHNTKRSVIDRINAPAHIII
jgi:hypothetical protein